MRIIIDLQGAQTINRLRGIGRYTLSLLCAILHNSAGRHEFWLVQNSRLPLLSNANCQQLFQYIPKNQLLTCHLPALCAWNESTSVWWQRAGEYCREAFLAGLNPDRVLVSSLFEGDDQSSAYTSIGSLFPEVPTAVILYDLIPLLNAGEYLCGALKRDWYLSKIKNLLRANLILAISEYACQEAMDTLHLPAQRIETIGSAYNAELFKPLSLDATALTDLWEKYGVKVPFLMHNGTLEPRKNLGGLIRAFALLPPEVRGLYQLVYVGEISEEDRLFFHGFASELDCADQLVLTGYVRDEELVCLFNAATLFVYPSLHEGFGLPALEAMACGTPTIGSDCTSIPEVIGRIDALFDPRNPQSISGLILRVLESPSFAEDLRHYGLERARCFSWDLCAQHALRAIEQPFANSSVKKTHLVRLLPEWLSAKGALTDSCSRKYSQSNGAGPSNCGNWPELVAEQRQHAHRLVSAIADLGSAHDHDIQALAQCITENQRVTDNVLRRRMLPSVLRWRIEGPFDSSYSLALLNRETALALHRLGHDVALHSTEGPGDFPPSHAFLAKQPLLAQLHQRSSGLEAAIADVTSRNLYPPRVTDLNCRINLLHHYAWEESGFPPQWVTDFNDALQGITCISNHVRKVLVDNGVAIPLEVSGCGVDHWLRIESANETYGMAAKKFRFLHVSSCFPRKGVDALLAAYGQSFTSADDVTLIIKTFSNPHNDLEHWLAVVRAAQPDFPDVLVIEEDLSAARLKALYEQCQALVAPSRAEGFGLPLAEAMLSGLSVITTNWGGQRDFCTDETAWLVDYQFVPSRSHFEVFDSVWAEPDRNHLAQRMRDVYAASADQRQQRCDAAKQLLLGKFCWSHVVERLVTSARRWSQWPCSPANLKIGWVSTWNTRCGIAGYSWHLINNMRVPITVLAPDVSEAEIINSDTSNVVRCWRQHDDDLQRLDATITQHRFDELIIQFNYYFFNFPMLGSFLENQLAAGRILIVVLHATIDPPVEFDRRLEQLVPVFQRCHRLLVHSVSDLNRLKLYGLVDNVVLFPHGIVECQQNIEEYSLPLEKNSSRCIGSYGYFLPHKGLLELIEAIALLREQEMDVHLRLVNAEYPVADSRALVEEAKQLIRQRNLEGHCELYTEYLQDEQSLALLRGCELLVFPYQYTGESSSSAVRYGLSTGRPVAVTPNPIFEDVAVAVFQLPGFSAQEIAHGIREVLQQQDSAMSLQISANARRWCENHSHSRLGARLLGMCRALHREQVSN